MNDRIRPLGRRKKEDGQDAENRQGGQFPSNTARSHQLIINYNRIELVPLKADQRETTRSAEREAQRFAVTFDRFSESRTVQIP